MLNDGYSMCVGAFTPVSPPHITATSSPTTACFTSAAVSAMLSPSSSSPASFAMAAKAAAG